MGKIHMETEAVRNSASRMDQGVQELDDNLERLKQLARRLDSAWDGGSSNRFIQNFNLCLSKLGSQIQQLETLRASLSAEIDQWQQEDADGVGRVNPSNLCKDRLPAGFELPYLGAGLAGIVLLSQPNWFLRENGMSVTYDKDIDKFSEYYLQRGEEADVYIGYLEGDLTKKQFDDFINKNPIKHRYVDGSITFFDEHVSAQASALDGKMATQYGTFSGALLATEAAAGYKGKYDKDGLSAVADASIGAYLAKGEYNLDMGALDVAVAGYLGANAIARTAMVFDPKKGEAGVKLGAEAFVGGKIEGDVNLDLPVGLDAKAHGGVSYGLGAKAKGELGFTEGSIKGELELGATIGLGLELGISFDLNLQEAVDAVVHAGQTAGNM